MSISFSRDYGSSPEAPRENEFAGTIRQLQQLLAELESVDVDVRAISEGLQQRLSALCETPKGVARRSA